LHALAERGNCDASRCAVSESEIPVRVAKWDDGIELLSETVAVKQKSGAMTTWMAAVVISTWLKFKQRLSSRVYCRVNRDESILEDRMLLYVKPSRFEAGYAVYWEFHGS